MFCCCKKEPAPKGIENTKRVAFWLAFAAFFIIYAILIDKAVEDNKSYKKPASLGMVLGR
jgi:hypothetical protein